jgi:hypothetical protein
MAADFAESVENAAQVHDAPDPWEPGASCSDANPGLEVALADLGWETLGSDPDLLAFAGPAAVPLGRRFASLAPIDGLLGGALAVRGLARYADGAPRLLSPRRGQLLVVEAEALVPMRYADSLGVVRLRGTRATGALAPAESERRMAAWLAASAGYLAGMLGACAQLTVQHAHSRRAFGRRLSAIEPVQQMLADIAVSARGLELLAQADISAEAAIFAAQAARVALDSAHQVVGAIGFTLEFPLQRAYRRAGAMQTWLEQAVEDWSPE